MSALRLLKRHGVRGDGRGWLGRQDFTRLKFALRLGSKTDRETGSRLRFCWIQRKRNRLAREKEAKFACFDILATYPRVWLHLSGVERRPTEAMADERRVMLN